MFETSTESAISTSSPATCGGCGGGEEEGQDVLAAAEDGQLHYGRAEPQGIREDLLSRSGACEDGHLGALPWPADWRHLPQDHARLRDVGAVGAGVVQLYLTGPGARRPAPRVYCTVFGSWSFTGV